MTGSRAPWLVVLAGAVLLTACSTAQGPPSTATASQTKAAADSSGGSASPATSPGSLHMLVVGDSIPASQFCSGCSVFPDQYRAELANKTHRQVDLVNLARNDGAQLGDILTQVTKDPSTQAEIKRSHILIVSAGYNDAFPLFVPGRPGCTGTVANDDATEVAYVLAATHPCLDSAIKSYAKDYDTLFSSLESQAPVGGLRIALNVFDQSIDFPPFNKYTPTAALTTRFNATLAYTYTQWNKMLCERAAAHGFVCLDVYHAINGPNGLVSANAYTGDDGAHPSQKGHDLIASLLSKVDATSVANAG